MSKDRTDEIRAHPVKDNLDSASMKVWTESRYSHNPHDKSSKKHKPSKRRPKDQRKREIEHDILGIGSQFDE
jgi:hypothetical protein